MLRCASGQHFAIPRTQWSAPQRQLTYSWLQAEVAKEPTFSYELRRKIFLNRSKADATVARRPRTGIVSGSTGTISDFFASGRSFASLFPPEVAAGFGVRMASTEGFGAGGEAGLVVVALSYLAGT
mmetsp:Transcript_11753/g.17000  ORF Transcript_11753/g.17000 Transcript_11753/m.17000 type:complete len:126 (-) Transcript_11753:261-638(-)